MKTLSTTLLFFSALSIGFAETPAFLGEVVEIDQIEIGYGLAVSLFLFPYIWAI